ncbi:hypothetical protein KLP28_00935 [Nocardioidaceae bacterium]|nr:hypothetical protein KLP28_00935 [Nocardioidaceae bacterium]
MTPQPMRQPRVIESWGPRLWVRLRLLLLPVVGGPLLVWLAVHDPREYLLGPWLLAWIAGASLLTFLALTGVRARMQMRDDGVAIRAAYRDRLTTWENLHHAVASWGGVHLHSYETWGSDYDQYVTGGIIVADWRRPWRWTKRSQEVADRINDELDRRQPIG